MNTSHTHAPCFAEVIQSTLTMCTAQAWDWEQSPSFGDLVCIEHTDMVVYGIVTSIETGSTDPQRQPFAYQKTEAELRAQHPQVFSFLKTTFTIALAGYTARNTTHGLRYTIPPTPARIHAFVRPTTAPEQEAFFATPHFFSVLWSSTGQDPLLDELIITLLASLISRNILTPELFEQYYHTLTLLLGNDYRRLKILLQRLEGPYASTVEKKMHLA